MANILSITYENAVTLTDVPASDTVNSGPWAGFWTGAGGTLKVRTVAGNDVTITNLPAGTMMPLAIQRIFATPAPPAGVLYLQASPYRAGL